MGDGCGLLALVLELRDVRARGEGLRSGPGHDHDPNRRIGRELGHDLERRFPHLERDGVVALGIVEDHPADAAVLAGDHLFASHRVLLRRFPGP
jgi:hypothetical protein